MSKVTRIFAPIDVRYFEDDRILAVGPDWQLHFAAILACKGLLKDELTRRQLARIAPDSVGDIARSIDHLIEVGLFIDKGDTIAIHAYSDWNDSAEDVEAMVKGGEYGNHLRWHVRRNVVKDGCSFCSDRGESGGESLPESGPESQIQSRDRSDTETNTNKTSASPSARDEVFEFLCEVDHIDWHKDKATTKELGRVRSARKGLGKIEATVDQIKSVKAAMESAGWKPQMITSTSIESNFSKFLDTAETQPSAIKACWKCYALTSRECSIYADCPNKPGASQITACSLCGDEFSNQPCYIKDECPRRATNG